MLHLRDMDKNFAYEHILYELSRHDIGRHRDMQCALGKIGMIMKVMVFRKAIGRNWTAKIEDGKVLLTWSGVLAGDSDQDVSFDFDSLLKEKAEAIKDIATVSSC
jgi:hypothetical protein